MGHTRNTMEALRLLYERLGEAIGVRLDTHSLAVIVSSQIFSMLNHYVGLSKRERARARPALLRATMQLMVGGVLAVRLPDDEATASADVAPPAAEETSDARERG